MVSIENETDQIVDKQLWHVKKTYHRTSMCKKNVISQYNAMGCLMDITVINSVRLVCPGDIRSHKTISVSSCIRNVNIKKAISCSLHNI